LTPINDQTRTGEIHKLSGPSNSAPSGSQHIRSTKPQPLTI